MSPLGLLVLLGPAEVDGLHHLSLLLELVILDFDLLSFRLGFLVLSKLFAGAFD